MGKLDGKVALISGGARGQGAAEAETFAREGAKVVFGDIRDPEGQKIEAAIRDAQGESTYVHLDVISEADWQNAVQTAIRRYGRLNVLINNAAIVIPRVPIEERTAEEWDRVMAVNAKDRIRCNSVHPGPVDTEMFHSAFRDREALERRLQRVPLGRMGTVAEIVTAVLYLASDDSSYMTGSELVIDGGALAQ